MQKLTTGRVVLSTQKDKKKPIKSTVSKKVIEVEEYAQEKGILNAVEELTGFKLTLEQVKKVLQNLNIDPNKDLSEDDLLLIYNIFTEPLIARENNQFVFQTTEDITNQEYVDQVNQDSVLFKRVLPNQRVQAMYEFLPSMEVNRINFRIDKDIFRNKPLLGQGLYKCSRCGSNDTEDMEKQTRSADEPMTIFVTCKACGHKFKFN
jgi:DNA-directed RNA polymerase subunit M/transcription elongation factor TFIIS